VHYKKNRKGPRLLAPLVDTVLTALEELELAEDDMLVDTMLVEVTVVAPPPLVAKETEIDNLRETPEGPAPPDIGLHAAPDCRFSTRRSLRYSGNSQTSAKVLYKLNGPSWRRVDLYILHKPSW